MGLTHTKLHHKVNKGSWDEVQKRIRTRDGVAEAQTANPCGDYPLHIACYGGLAPVSVIKDLLYAYPEALHAKNDEGFYPLELARINYLEDSLHRDDVIKALEGGLNDPVAIRAPIAMDDSLSSATARTGGVSTVTNDSVASVGTRASSASTSASIESEDSAASTARGTGNVPVESVTADETKSFLLSECDVQQQRELLSHFEQLKGQSTSDSRALAAGTRASSASTSTSIAAKESAASTARRTGGTTTVTPVLSNNSIASRAAQTTSTSTTERPDGSVFKTTETTYDDGSVRVVRESFDSLGRKVERVVKTKKPTRSGGRKNMEPSQGNARETDRHRPSSSDAHTKRKEDSMARSVEQTNAAIIDKTRMKIQRCIEQRFPPSHISLEYIEVITDKFSDNRMLGEGAFGRVYLGCDRHLRKKFAIKAAKIQPNRFGDDADLDTIRRTFRRELDALRVFRHHPNIASLYGYYFADDLKGPKCLVFEYASKGSLHRFLDNSSGREELDWRMRINIALDIAKAVNYLHKGGPGFECFHRDIKPSNVCLKDDFTAQLIDCGLSKLVGEKRSTTGVSVITTTGTLFGGSPGYMCPTYARKGTNFGSANDVYSLGVVLVELFCGCLQNTVVEGTEIDLDEIYGPDGEKEQRLEDNADLFAGEWDEAVRREFASLAIKCLHHRPKPRPNIEEIVDLLRLWARAHCQPTPSEAALRLSEAHIKSIKPALDQAGNEAKVYHCRECMLELPGVFCHHAERKHFRCMMCFEKHVARHLGDDDIRCPERGCSSRAFSDDELLYMVPYALFAQRCQCRYLQRQNRRLNRGHMAELGRLRMSQKSVKSRLLSIDHKLDNVTSEIDRCIAVLSSLSGGVTSPCPKLAVLLPHGMSWMEWMKSVGKKTVLLYFICGHSYTLVEPPITLQVTRDWVRRAAPFLKVSLFALQVAVVSLRLGTGLLLPLPVSSPSGVALQLEEIDGVLDSTLDTTTAELLGRVRYSVRTPDGRVSALTRDRELRGISGKAYETVAEEANKFKNSEWKCRMIPVLDKQGDIMWVKSEFKNEYSR